MPKGFRVKTEIEANKSAPNKSNVGAAYITDIVAEDFEQISLFNTRCTVENLDAFL